MDNLKRLRNRAQMSQIEAAKELHVTQATISNWEHGRFVPKTEQLPAIAKLYGCTIDDLFREGEVEK